MTLCPYCENPIAPDAPECPDCRLSFHRTCALVGAVPRLNTVVADTTGRLNGSVVLKINRRILKIQRRFPQLVIQVVMHQFAVTHPFSMHAFWLFNAGAFAGEIKRGKDNHAVLVLVDPERRESAIVPGYGLEPFIARQALNDILEAADTDFQSGKWGQGLGTVLDGLEKLLESVSVADPSKAHGAAGF